jgi:hypothetical protein
VPNALESRLAERTKEKIVVFSLRISAHPYVDRIIQVLFFARATLIDKLIESGLCGGATIFWGIPKR